MAIALGFPPHAAIQAQPSSPPKLVVAISVDQFSADLFAQYRQHFTGGLARLARGVVFPSGYQAHAATETCPGHSTILTGSRPARTGIIANDWFNLHVRREKRIYCAEDERDPASSPDEPVVSPYHLRVPALGDHLKRANPASRVVVVSGKDRSAVMMGGHDPDERWWWRRGAFVTHAGRQVPGAVARVNANIAEAMSRPREPFPLPPACEARSRAIALQGRAGGSVGEGRFARDALAPNRRDPFRVSPDFDAAVLDIASGLREDLRLGEGAASDLLILGLSATDYVGHTFGTQGSEMCIQLFELDRALDAFFQRLDSSGVDYAVMLTADHGGIDIPERASQQAVPEAERVQEALSVGRINAHLRARFALQVDPLYGEFVAGDLYVSDELAPGLRQRVIDEAVRLYRASPQVAAVFTNAEIGAAPAPSGPPETWTLLQRARASYDPERSGDFLVLLQPRISPIFNPQGYVATHGSPWDYDRRVPILFWRRGLAPFEQPLSVETVDILPTLAALIGITIPPGTIDGRCLDLIEGPETSCPQ